ncbi:MAG: cardiolipin synthase [Bacteroidetes bacterium]|nr:cardiolipin synthase [Bacteroidota bacterium]
MFLSVTFDQIWAHFADIFSIIYVITIIFTVIFVILQNRNPIKTISWVIVLVLLPVIGIIVYLYFGQNYRKAKIFSRKGISDYQKIEKLSKIQIKKLPDRKFLKNPKLKEKLNIITLLLNNSKALLSEKNKVKILKNGKQTFGSILYELENAKHHIHIEYYIIANDNIGNRIKEILKRKAQQGVEVRLIYDDVGSWSLKKRYVRSLQKAGIEVKCFMPVRFPFLTSKLNYRNHRKIIVIDGEIGFVGGLNIADYYITGTKKLGPWRDTHLRLEGEAVASLQVVFLIDWYFITKKLIDGEKYFPENKVVEEHLVQITASGPDSDWASIMQSYFVAITTAKNYIYISTPYLMPNESILTALTTAALSGIDVRIILSEKFDSKMVYWSTMSFVRDLLEAGIKVYFYQKGFSHSKLIMVDDVFSSVGTANLDYRSFDQNFEVNALIYDERITSELKKNFIEDMTNSKQMSLDEWIKRPNANKIKASFARLFSPLM